MAASEEVLEKWWVKWREADFTWEGLAKEKPLQGWVVAEGLLREADSGRVYGQPIPDASAPVNGREATLQDYWRADPTTGRLRDDAEMAGEFASITGQPTYHIAHLPLAYADGTATGKADWADDALDAIVQSRLAAASETFWEKTDHPPKIVGPDRDAQLQGGVWLKAARRPKGDDQSPLCIRHNLALIFRHCDFAQARFSGVARFGGAAFSGEAVFEGAAFSGEARYDDAAFSGGAWFSGATFGGEARFDAAAFSGRAWFDRAAFSGEARYDAAAFSGVARFDDAAFSGGAWFDRAAFSGVAWFSGAAFSAEARFDDAAFSGVAWFNRAAFSGEAAFQACSFAKHVYFDIARFEGDMDFTSATFETLVSFEEIVWPESAAHWHGAFEQVLFRGNLSLVGAGFRSFAAFDGATLERGLQFDETGELAAKARFRAERRAAIAAAQADGESFQAENPEAKKRDIAAHVRAQREARLRELERGCRVLKLAFERAANKSREQLLYRFELQARRVQRELPPGEALFSDLYALASDYGASMVRPFVALTVLIAFFAGVYLVCGYGLGMVGAPPNIAHLAQAFEFSLTNTFRPLSALSAEGMREGGLGARLLMHDDLTALGIRALSILQSLLAIVLAFLFALAVRRRFQIS